jgi:ABC-type Zn2+ transport system substrate-binding protein/surface adhesin
VVRLPDRIRRLAAAVRLERPESRRHSGLPRQRSIGLGHRPASRFARQLLLGLGLLLGALPLHADAPLRVVASTEPLRAIAAAVGGELADTETLFAAHADQHHAALRPSSLRRLYAADLVLWAGQADDPLLERLTDRVAVLTPDRLAEPVADPEHVWLSPALARALAGLLGAELARLRPGEAAVISARVAAFDGAVREVEAELGARFDALRGRGLLVAHDAYRPFLDAFGVTQLAALRGVHDEAPGARTAAAFRAAAARDDAACLVAGSAAELEAAQRMLGEHGLEVRLLPPEGPTTRLDDYPAFLRWLGAEIADCLA